MKNYRSMWVDQSLTLISMLNSLVLGGSGGKFYLLSVIRIFMVMTTLSILSVTQSFAAMIQEKKVQNTAELKKAIQTARPGDVITLSAGEYNIRRKIKTFSPGSTGRPIIVRANSLGKVRIKSSSSIAFHIRTSHWIFENLDIEGVCKQHSSCEHAFQITGSADNTTIRNNRMHDFNAMIKLNGGRYKPGGERNPKPTFPNGVLIEGNIFFNSTVRNTGNPVSLINLDGGRRLVVRGNLIADFAKSHGTNVSYGAFMKGLTRDGIFERNLIICELKHKGYERVGLSFGGGGTSKSIREEPVGDFETLNGIMRNNIIMNCPGSVGIYLNKAGDTKIYNNTLFNTFGIDVRFKESFADIRNNIISGGIRNRDGGQNTAADNFVAGMAYSHDFPGGVRYLKKRLEGQDRKYPSYIDKSDVEFAQSLVQRGLELVAPTWMGNGANSIRSLFVDVDNANYALRDPEPIVDRGQVLKEVRNDFCGNPRNLPPHDVGAIEYGGKPCDVSERMRNVR